MPVEVGLAVGETNSARRLAKQRTSVSRGKARYDPGLDILRKNLATRGRRIRLREQVCLIVITDYVSIKQACEDGRMS